MTPAESVGAVIAGEAEVLPIPTTVDVVREAMYVSVVGSRLYPNEDEYGWRRMVSLVELLHESATVVTGGAPGPDTWAENLANERGLRCAVVRPSKGGNHLPMDYLGRNTVIVRGSDVCVAFWDGTSNGTKDSIETALRCHGFCVVALPGQPPQVWVHRLVAKGKA